MSLREWCQVWFKQKSQSQRGVQLTSDDGARKSVSAVESDTVTASRAINLDLASVRLEALGGVLGGDSALEGETTDRDPVLCEAELFERGTSSDLNLRGDNVDAGNLLGDGVLDLAVWKSDGETPQISRGNTYILGLISIK